MTRKRAKAPSLQKKNPKAVRRAKRLLFEADHERMQRVNNLSAALDEALEEEEAELLPTNASCLSRGVQPQAETGCEAKHPKRMSSLNDMATMHRLVDRLSFRALARSEPNEDSCSEASTTTEQMTAAMIEAAATRETNQWKKTRKS